MRKSQKKADTPKLKYPLLEKKQKGSTVMERKVRRLLNEQTDESHKEAWRILSGIQPQKRHAEWYFLSGCLRYRIGYYTDAVAYIEKAMELSGGDVLEYNQMAYQLQNSTEGEDLSRFGTPMENLTPAGKGTMFFGFMGECCTEGCCDCCCEGCCEGICEGLGDGCS